jgi:hypothetical protein
VGRGVWARTARRLPAGCASSGEGVRALVLVLLVGGSVLMGATEGVLKGRAYHEGLSETMGDAA